ncbi:GxxExxY protein [Desulfuromonas sp. AOP6]|uniref:GxxExxY protein n=1 Tax=Desulfuromonas sp. AOP6 TaxID=1566351 RepID=UPI00126AA379|nr:GxxExxY protein [Desulfuromonas sp. AOP6]BCA80090.1 hypothetical protein AOP6_1877 [Desulfuromonas sp. AOP6]
MLLEDLTQRILKTSFQVSNELGSGFLESVYENALLVALRDEGMRASSQVPLNVPFRGVIVGHFVADLVVEDKVLVELKAVKALAPEHVAQVLNYLKATKIEVGLLINFGNPKLEYRRFNNHFND